MALLDDLRQQFGVTIIIATHDEDVASHTGAACASVTGPFPRTPPSQCEGSVLFVV